MTKYIATLWPDRRTVWRWHFLAGLFCLPFVAFLSLTGAVYLFKPQIDAWIDWQYDHLPTALSPSPTRDVQAALSAVPQGAFLAYELPQTSHSAARVLVSKPDGEAVRVYVNRNTHTVLKIVMEEDRFERLVFRLHGQLLLGNVGSVIMEMVASWTIVLIVTGLLLWWPRHQYGLAGVVYLRLGIKGRIRWRDLHAVTGVWMSVFLVLFLVSGLPWSFVWGHALQSVENAAGRLTSVMDWEIGAVPAATVIAGHPVRQSKKQSGYCCTDCAHSRPACSGNHYDVWFCVDCTLRHTKPTSARKHYGYIRWSYDNTGNLRPERPYRPDHWLWRCST